MVSVRTTDMKIIGLSKTVKVKGNSAVQRSPQNTAQQRRQPDLTTVLFNEGVLLATSLFIIALGAYTSSGLRRMRWPLVSQSFRVDYYENVTNEYYIQ